MGEVKIERKHVNTDLVKGLTEQEKVEWILDIHDLAHAQKVYQEKIDSLEEEETSTKKMLWFVPAIGVLPMLFGGIELNGSKLGGGLVFLVTVMVVLLPLFLIEINVIRRELERCKQNGVYLAVLQEKGYSASKEKLEHFRESINGGEPIGVTDKVFTLDTAKFEELLETY